MLAKLSTEWHATLPLRSQLRAVALCRTELPHEVFSSETNNFYNWNIGKKNLSIMLSVIIIIDICEYHIVIFMNSWTEKKYIFM